MRADPLAHPEPLIEKVYSYVAYRVGDGPDAEDVTNDVFERALRYRESYDPSKGAPVAWLIGIARRCIDDFGSKRSLVAQPAEVLEERAPQELESETIRRLALAAAVSRLDPRARDLIALRYGGDLTARQIATIMDSETNAIEVALHRALARLRTELERDSGAHVDAPRLASGSR